MFKKKALFENYGISALGSADNADSYIYMLTCPISTDAMFPFARLGTPVVGIALFTIGVENAMIPIGALGDMDGQSKIRIIIR